MSDNGALLLRALDHPERLKSLDADGWNCVMRQARAGNLVARLGHLALERGVLADLPEKAADHFAAARAEAAQHERVVRWEANRVLRALVDVDTDVVLLKGGAYVMAGLPPARGRRVSDLDILVPFDKLEIVERALLDHGWEHLKVDKYDQRYYRAWMHELPPLRHHHRRSVLDVHHTILPPTGRLRPDPDLLLASAIPVGGGLPDKLKVLCPHDMVLHSAAHMFQDGELAGSLRDLTDLDDLLRHFGEHEDGFWDGLVDRAVRLQLQRPLYYALRYTRRMLGTPVPGRVVAAAEIGRPITPIPRVMDALVGRALVADASQEIPWTSEAARLLLYIRAHWLRMPAGLLIRHLWRKTLKSWALTKDDDETKL